MKMWMRNLRSRLRQRRTWWRYRTRYPWLPPWGEPKSEADVHPHVPAERAELFEAYDMGTTELEVLNWLNATIRVLKPESVLETGVANSLGTIALAQACRMNGRGKVHSVEIDPERCSAAEAKLRHLGLEGQAEIHRDDSQSFLRTTDLSFDIGFFDSEPELRAEEFRICLERGILRRVAVFHDTSPLRCESLDGWPSPEEHRAYRRDLLELARDPRCSGFFESTLSRGFFCIFLSPPSS